MKVTKTDFPDLLILEPSVFKDSRGYFFESYNAAELAAHQIDIVFVQDNQARSSYGVVRGLHYQNAPYAQTKLIRVISGVILDAVVDLRKESPMYGKSFCITLSAENNLQLLIPKGFAHGYSVLSETAEVMYKCDAFYNKQAEGSIQMNDPALAIDWKIATTDQIISEKDLLSPLFADSVHQF